jgi:hypothetical protein
LEIEYYEAKRIMAKQGVQPDLLVLWPGGSLFLGTEHPKKTEYWAAGPDGNWVLQKGPEALSFADQKVNIVEIRDFDVYTDTPTSIELLTRAITIGEYNTMLAWWRADADISNYESRWRDILMYNENLDKMEKVHFRDAFINAHIFERNNEYKQKLKDFVKNHSRHWKAQYSKTADHQFRDEKETKEDEDHPFFLASPDDHGVYTLIEYFGQMDLCAASSKDMEQIAQTLLRKIPGDHGSDVKTFHDCIGLIQNIEMQEYDHEYWKALIEENLPYSIDKKDNWIGDETPKELVSDPSISDLLLREWTPNNYGSLRLPQKVTGANFPSGFANGPGFLTLADEALKDKSPWRHCGEIAAEGIKMMNRIIHTLKEILPTCEMLNPNNRSPWFHKPYPISTFFQLLSIERDPIWIAHARSVKDKGTVKDPDEVVRGETYGSSGKEEDRITWGPDPLFLVNEFKDKEVKASKALEFVYESPITSKPVKIPMEYVASGAILSDEIRAISLLGEESYKHLLLIGSYINSDAKMSAEQKTEYKRKVITFINTYGRTKSNHVRECVIGLSVEIKTAIERNADIAPVIDNLVNLISQSASKKARQEAKDAVNRYIEYAADIKDQNLEFSIDPFKLDRDTKKKTIKRNVSFEEVKGDIEKVLDLVASVNILRGTNTTFSFKTPKAFADVSDTPEIEKMTNEIIILATKVNTALDVSSLGLTPKKEKEIYDRADKYKPKSRFHIEDDENSFYGSQFYRSPLTMSLSLLESIAHKMPRVYIRPSNPNTGHLSPFAQTSDQKKSLPDDIWRRPNYANVSQSMDSHNEKNIEHLSFIGKHFRQEAEIRVSNASRSEPKKRQNEFFGELIGASESLKKRKMDFFDDDDDMDDVGPSMRGETYDEPRIPDKWSKKDLERVPKWDDKRGYQEYNAQTRPFDQADRNYSQLIEKLVRPAFIVRYSKCKNIADPILRIICQCFLTSRADNGDQWLKMIDNNVLVPISFILWRLFIEHDMASAILMKGGPDTGGNLYGHSNFAFGSNVSTKMLLGNFTFYSKAMVWKEKNVYILDNIAPRRYRGGSDCGFIFKKTQIGHNSEEEFDINRPSILVTAVPLSFDKCERMMSFTGKHHIPNVNESIDGPLRVTYPTWQYYDSLWGFSHKMTKTHPGYDDFVRRTGRLSPHAFQGQQVSFNITYKCYNIVDQCQGHRKGASYPGALKVWNGKGTHILYEWSNFSAA